MRRKQNLARMFFLLLLSATFGCQTAKAAPDVVAVAMPAAMADKAGPSADRKEQSSYAVGLDIGRDLRSQALGLSLEPLLQGVRDGVEGKEPRLSQAELDLVRQAFVKARLQARAAELGPEAEKNFSAAEAFLAENAHKEGVKSLPSGLQYRVLKQGEGAVPAAGNNVKAHYVVRSLDGTELESTHKKGAPGVFPVVGVIPAWTEALQLMKEGAKWELYAPPYLAYGEKGIGKAVGPFQGLIFEMELISIH